MVLVVLLVHANQICSADWLLATFDAPGQAIRCAAAVLADGAAADMVLRAGIQTGEVDVAGKDIKGRSVRIADPVAALARPGEILVSRTVKDLVAGSGISFAGRGSYVLDAPSEQWPLFAVLGVIANSGTALSGEDG